ncbi:trypsin-like peptidase domain-containing protein [Hoyosella rhizosphaerae]|uniref:Serine protease HtrA n=1 Tax=Hoyosella rhizosphaerae TaxID=1755582 RepID=A0A916UDX3_9ACTN|nr:trypsin-like peptidase domain-containing protein [Hoyosella rhizosphaerae]MBN4925594.1 trypsin-like peptidase domain-containing protein [Hoyosella rhizosphaerae]GGC69419.1 putative serine protease HtrA [Hoyosella rhizosphaerae]
MSPHASDSTEPHYTPPRLSPKPISKPQVSPDAARAFGRPAGLDGPFSPATHRAASDRGEDDRHITVQRPDPILAEAFGRPDGSDGGLQRSPEKPTPHRGGPGAPADPWRDPSSTVALGGPAEEKPDPDSPPEQPLRKLTTREILFGKRVERRALATLTVIALVVGLAGGLIGRITAEVYESRTSSRVTVGQVSSDNTDPRGPVAAVANAVTPSVVSVRVRVGNQASTGSGVVIDEEGFIVTNNHVVSLGARTGDAEIEILFFDGTRASANIVGRDTRTDLAVLRTSADNLTVAEFGESSEVQVGEEVIAIGAPLGLDRTVTRGIVSALNRPVPLSGPGTDTDGVIDAIQTDASINPGNSGGPLVDLQGRIIGINTAIQSGTGGSIGLGFAIPSDTVVSIIQQLIRQGSAEHAGIGVTARTVVNEAVAGAQIANVNAGSPAEAAGIREGDVVVQVGDREVFSADELTVAVGALRADEPVTLRVIREGRSVEIEVTPRILP